MTLMTGDNSGGCAPSEIARQFSAIRDAVIDYWEREVRARVDGASEVLDPILINTLPQFFDNIAEALSPACRREDATSNTNAAAVHGGERARMTPFGADQVVHEYQIFREAIAAVAPGRVALGEIDWGIIDRSINAATREAVRAFSRIHEDLRRKVAAALTHDMRTPLAVIVNGAELIGLTEDLERAKSTASKIQSNARRLVVMMGDLLDALTFHGGASVPLNLSCFDMTELTAELRDQYRQIIGLGFEFNAVGEPVVGYWCRGSMRRALENLINNAIKYGDGGAIDLRVRQLRGRLMLSVHNEGKPIPEAQQDSIFEYLRREGAAPTVMGWGIGLPFVRAVAESHGGSVSVDSAAETGTTFVIDVPVDCRPYVGPAQDGREGRARPG